MKILYISIPEYIESGVVSVTKYLTKGIKSKGFEVKLVSCWPGIGYYNYENYNYIPEKESVPLSVEEIVNVAQEFKPDIIHAHTMGIAESWHGGINLIKDAAGNPPLVYTLHTPKQVRLDGPTEEMLKISNVIVTISESHRKAFTAVYPQYKEKTISIHNFPEPNYMVFTNSPNINSRARTLLNKFAPNGEKLVVYIGRLEKLKGIKYLILAFMTLLSKYPNSKLILIGATGTATDRQNLEEWGLEPRIIENNVIFVGWIRNDEELASYYRMLFLDDKINGVCVAPIAARAFMVFMNAITMKAPIVAFGNIDEPLATSESLLATPRNMFNCIDMVFSANPLDIKNKLENSYNIVKSKYSLENYIENHVKLYKDLLENKIANTKIEDELGKILKELENESQKGELNDELIEEALNELEEEQIEHDREIESVISELT